MVVPHWMPIAGEIMAINDKNVTLNGNEYAFTDNMNDQHKHFKQGDPVQIMRNKEGLVTMIAKVNNYTANKKEPEEPKPMNEPTINRRDELIIRQNALAHADNWIGMIWSEDLVKMEDREETQKTAKEIYFKFAEECERWIRR